MTMILGVCAALTIGLAAYSLGHYLCALLFVTARPRPRSFADHPGDSVAVLIPARNEGDRAGRVLASLLSQDHRGPIEIHLLVRDADDSSVPYFEQQFPGVNLRVPAPATIELPSAGSHRVAIVYTGVDPKSEKVNWMVARVATTWVAILDCDHQAHPDWLRTSIALAREQGVRAVQARREPISARGFFQLWDSLHQHIGCELFNAAFTRLNLTVFFTGTAAVIDTALLRARPLSACITEDVYFSYGILLDGHRIISNPYSGSAEETSPDLYSFLARRRRWSNGHTQAFFAHLRGISRLGPREAVQFLFHGSHYLVSVVVFVLHLLIGLVFIRELSPISEAAALLSSLMVATLIARTQRTLGWASRLLEVAILFAWIFPAVVIAMNMVHVVLLGDVSRAALPIPYAVQAVGLVGLGAPLVVLLLGLAGFGQLGAGSFLAVVLTYPLAFYLDISGVLLGMGDFATGRARWRAVSRAAVGRAGGPVVIGIRSGLTPTLDIRRSWHLAGTRGTLAPGFLRLLKPSHLASAALVLALFCGGVIYAPSTRIEVVPAACEALAWDGDPWIVPAAKMPDYCGPSARKGGATDRTGAFQLVRADDLATVDPAFWDRLDSTFFCNQAVFSPDNVVPLEGGGVSLKLGGQVTPERLYSAGSIATKPVPDAKFTYGRFEAVLKPARGSGLLTAFFLYRFDPWQEIDTEFLGKDTTKLLLNVYYNPGEEGDLYNYGHLGTPVIIDLGFDAADDFHRYALEWEAEEIRWFVDDRLVHVRKAGRPTPIPHLPMQFHLNMWPICSEDLAGPFVPIEASADIRSVAISKWHPSPVPRFVSRLGSLFSDDWRDDATWIQP